MTIIDIMNQYGVIIAIAGIVTCILCGLLKVPIAKKIREKCLVEGLDNKVAADRVRNVCNAIVVVLSAVFISAWYISTENITVMMQAKVYADILATFTVAKLVYMIYEGAGEVSIKKICREIIDKIKQRNLNHLTLATATTSPIEVITEYLKSNVALPLTDTQVEELRNLLELDQKETLWKRNKF